MAFISCNANGSTHDSSQMCFHKASLASVGLRERETILGLHKVRGLGQTAFIRQGSSMLTFGSHLDRGRWSPLPTPLCPHHFLSTDLAGALFSSART